MDNDKKENQTNPKLCGKVHTMYENVTCKKCENHEGLHSAFYEGENLRWGVPSNEEMYNVVRKKDKHD